MCKSKTSLFDLEEMKNIVLMVVWLYGCMVKKTNQPFIYLTIFFFISGCANIVTPSGGDKDIAPPVILKIIPENQSLNFDKKSFSISFNEYVQLNDISKQLIVSPPLKTTPEFVIKGKNIIVKFKDELSPNTTYTLNFGNAIRDINENNALENFTYVFSTGSFIDSLSLRGNVKNALTHENEKDVLVMLYEENIDSLPFLKLPYYYAKTDGSGNFALDNLRSGEYKIVALKDQNSSFMYDDFEKESIGFLDTLVAPYYIGKVNPKEKEIIPPGNKDSILPGKSDTVPAEKGLKKIADKSISILIFQEEKNRQYLKKAWCEHYGKLVFIFNKKITKLALNPLNTSFKKEWNIIEQSVTGDTVFAWLTDVGTDSLKLEITDNATVIDTVLIALKKREDAAEAETGSGKNKMGKGKKTFKLEMEQQKTSAPHNPAKDFFITFNHPVKDYDVTKFILRADSDTVKFTLDSKDAALRKYIIVYKWAEEKKYELFIPPASVTDIFDLKNDSIKISFTTQPKNYSGNVVIALKMTLTSGTFLLQLTDDKNNPVMEKSITGTEKISFPGLEPKSYGLRIVADENNNGKWDTGNYLQKKQAEKIIAYPQKINVRSNWDVEVEWELK